jgi:hypothetical protein
MAKLYRFQVCKKQDAKNQWSQFGDPLMTSLEARLMMNDDRKKNDPALAAEYAIVDLTENRVIDWRKAA